MSILARGSLSKLVMYLYRRVDGVSADAGDGALATLLLCETPTRRRLSSLQGVEDGRRLPRAFEEWFVSRENPQALVGIFGLVQFWQIAEPRHGQGPDRWQA